MAFETRIEGSIRLQVDDAVLAIAGALRRAVTTVGRQTQAALRAQARAAGFKDGGRAMANAWRLQVYPEAGRGARSWRPAALVRSKMPDLVHVFDQGAAVTAKGRKYLAIPTPINRLPGRRQDGRYRTRVTTQEMLRLGGFVRPTRNPNVRLWCLRLRSETSKRGRLRLFAGRYAEILTGRAKGQQARRQEYAAGHSFVPMFLLMKQVTLRKRIDLAGATAAARAALLGAVEAELARLGGGA
ncbi:MAG: hypothetical protein IT556_10340 [Acetobacteraceae bacterium]|nr:hypothetical protein [Acetobacteraceae bacterium]